MDKDKLLAEAKRRFPQNCSYYGLNSQGDSNEYSKPYKKVVYETPYFYEGNSIALIIGKGLVYCNGKWTKPIKSLYEIYY